MQAIINRIVKFRKTVMLIFLVLAAVSAILMTLVKINYNLQDYLPDNVPSATAIEVLQAEFDMSIPNARVVVPIQSLQDGLAVKARLEQVPGVEQVLWLDDTLDVAIPLEMADPETVQAFYKDGKALFQTTCDSSNAAAMLDLLYAVDPGVRVEGQLVDQANAQNAVTSEIAQLLAVVVPLVLLILVFGTHAWLEPVPFLLAIGIGIVLNLGTNIFLGEVSFITQAVAALLQMAVSMDYGIFLLNRFNENRKAGLTPQKAMAKAMRKSLTAVASSASTTLLGFLALLFMRFRIGADLGIVMAKGIVFSFLSVMIFMPAFLLIFYPLIDKTTHRSFMPNFSFLGRFVMKVRWPILILVLVVLLPSFLGSRKNSFIYGMGGYPPQSRIYHDRNEIRDEFGELKQLSLLVPRGDIRRELALQESLSADPDVVSVISYVETVDPAIPSAVLDQQELSMLISENYSHFIITAEIASEGDKAFALAERVRAAAAAQYNDNYYLTGENVIMLDMKNTIQADEIVVNGLAILAVALVILLAFRSVSIPLILVLTIELAIWINLSIPYFMGGSLSYIGYLIISTVQLGATVDYAILYTEQYLDNRKVSHKRKAVIDSSRQAIPSLLPPVMILSVAGFALQKTSTLAIVSELGQVLGRGAILSFLMVIFLLPCLLYTLDRVLPRTTLQLQMLPADQPEITGHDSLDGQSDAQVAAQNGGEV